jgi:excisionase family DNA binding protein
MDPAQDGRQDAAELLSTAAAARLAGVGPSSVKRWADQGTLACVRTAGGHRRFARATLQQFLQQQHEQPDAAAPGPSAWVSRLVAARRHEIEGALLESRARLGSWCAVADELGEALAQLGRGWQRGEVSIAEEHQAADCLGRALLRIGDSLPGRPGAPRALLACAPGDDHTLGLSLAELCLRERGYAPLWLGRQTPPAEILRIVEDGGAELVAISASSASTDAARLRRLAQKVGAACRDRAVSLILGGAGRWPKALTYGSRIHSFAELAACLPSLRLRPRP